MSKRRPRPKLGLNLAEVNAADTLEDSFMVKSDAFVNADFRVGKDGLIMSPGKGTGSSSSSSSSSSNQPMTPIVEGKQAAPSSNSAKKGGGSELNPDDLEIVKELGRGASSFVQLVRDKKTKKKMALKVINVFDKNMRLMLKQEIKALHAVSCPPAWWQQWLLLL